MAQWTLHGWPLLVNTVIPSAGRAQNRIISPSRFLSGQSLASWRLSHGQGGLALIPGQYGWVTEGQISVSALERTRPALELTVKGKQ